MIKTIQRIKKVNYDEYIKWLIRDYEEVQIKKIKIKSNRYFFHIEIILENGVEISSNEEDIFYYVYRDTKFYTNNVCNRIVLYFSGKFLWWKYSEKHFQLEFEEIL